MDSEALPAGHSITPVSDPFTHFGHWFAAASATEPSDANAFALATATPDGRPSVRIVLCKFWDARGFVFYTNLDSRKGQELAANQQVHMDFHWKSQKRQVRIEGRAELVPDMEADAYFASQPARFAAGRLGLGRNRSHCPIPARHSRRGLPKCHARCVLLMQNVPRPPRWSGLAGGSVSGNRILAGSR